jgi:hypothetical protein
MRNRFLNWMAVLGTSAALRESLAIGGWPGELNLSVWVGIVVCEVISRISKRAEKYMKLI